MARKRISRSLARNAFGSTRQRIGFTLVELLVVIGIIALLISILLPTLSKAQQAAATLKCSSNLRTIGQGLAMYLNDNKGTYPMADGTATASWPTQYDVGWSNYVMAELYPGIVIGPNSAYDPEMNMRMAGLFRCPACAIDVGGSTNFVSVPQITYAVHPIVFANATWNWKASQNMGWLGSPPDVHPYLAGDVPYYRSSWMTHSSEKAIVMDAQVQATANNPLQAMGWAQSACYDIDNPDPANDGAGASGYGMRGPGPNYYLLEDPGLWASGTPANILGQPVNLVGSDVDAVNPYWVCRPRFRHGRNNQGNFLFADGHVETFTRKTVAGVPVSALLRRNIAVGYSGQLLTSGQ